MGWKDIGSLECAHCKALFVGTLRQVKRVKYEKAPVYCSDFCRKTSQSLSKRKDVPQRGPCAHCGKNFESRSPKKFCSMACYTASRDFQEMLQSNREKARIASSDKSAAFVDEHTMPCLECSKPFYRPPAQKRRFCSKLCYRVYFSKRFDRWIASPESIALPQNYDEFLTQAELPCLVAGCGWFGHGLTAHMNQTHGVSASDFKRAAGFNLSTGVISAELSVKLAGRQNVGMALSPRSAASPPTPGNITGYHSLEGREHRRKAVAISGPGPDRNCDHCGAPFQQSRAVGLAKYCGKTCQNNAAAARASIKQFPLSCYKCEAVFMGNKSQWRRAEKGGPVFCCLPCRQSYVGAFRKRPIANVPPPSRR